MVEEDDTLEPEAYVLGWFAEACYHAHDVDKAWACAIRAEHVSRSLGEPPSVAGYAQMAVAFAHLAAGRAADAIEPARATLAMFGRAEKQMVGIGARLLAEALLLSGDLSAAQFEAENEIKLCRRTLRGNVEAGEGALGAKPGRPGAHVVRKVLSPATLKTSLAAPPESSRRYSRRACLAD